jgi:Ca2+-binding EF-hand superfamily protein
MEQKSNIQLSDERIIAEVKKVFSVYDVDSSGAIDKSELQALMTTLSGTTPPDSELTAVMNAVDSDDVSTNSIWFNRLIASIGWACSA